MRKQAQDLREHEHFVLSDQWYMRIRQPVEKQDQILVRHIQSGEKSWLHKTTEVKVLVYMTIKRWCKGCKVWTELSQCGSCHLCRQEAHCVRLSASQS